MTTRFNRIPKIFLAVTAFTFGVAGVAVASPGHQESPLANAKPAALVAQNGNGPAKMKRKQAKMTKRQARKAKRQANKAQRKQAKRAARIAKFDTNGNGKIEKPERIAYRGQRFAILDANGDGFVTLGELQQARVQKRAAKQATRKARRNARLAQLSPQKRAKRMERIAKRQARIKAKRSQGKGAKMAKRFAKLDIDSSGTLSQTEFTHRQEKRRGKAKGINL
ncbi:MAG: hypothetical protein GY811_30430 [Myxococcales bacterium]|nr:hypothetical protein [Myxococcales bacterium]